MTRLEGGPRVPFFVALQFLLLIVVFHAAVFDGATIHSLGSAASKDGFFSDLVTASASGDLNALMASDNERAWNPTRAYLHRALPEIGVPLWNPYGSHGLPFFAEEQSQASDPIFLLSSLLLPWHDSVLVFVALTFLLAGLGAYLFALELGASRWASTTSGLVYMLSGPLVVWFMRPNSQSYWVLPFVLLFSERGLATGRLLSRELVFAAVALSFSFLSGHTQLSLIISLSLTVYMLARAGPKRGLAFVGLVGLCVGGLCAFKLIPLFEMIQQAPVTGQGGRSSLLPFKWSTFEQIGLYGEILTDPKMIYSELVRQLWPHFYGSPSRSAHLGVFFENRVRLNFAERANYVGGLAACLGLAAFVTAKGERTKAIKWLAAFTLALGIGLPLISAIRFLPGVSLIEMRRIVAVWVFALAVLAGLGLDAFLRWKPENQVRFVFASGAIAAFVFLLAMEVHTPPRREALWAFLPALFFALAFLLSLVMKLRPSARRLFPAALLTFFALDSLHFAYDFIPFRSPKEWHRQTARVAALHHVDPSYRMKYFGTNFLPQYHLAHPGMAADATWSVLQVGTMEEIAAVASQRAAQIVPKHRGTAESIEAPWLALSSVRVVGFDQSARRVWDKPIAEHGGLSPSYRDPSVLMYRNEWALPRARVFTKVARARGSADVLELLATPGFDWRHTAVLDPSAQLSLADAAYGAGTATVSVLAFENDHVAFGVEASGPVIAGLGDTAYPGWEVEVNGEPAVPLRLHHTHRGVELGAGAHEVEWRFRPRSFALGSALTMLSLLLLAPLAWRGARAPRGERAKYDLYAWAPAALFGAIFTGGMLWSSPPSADPLDESGVYYRVVSERDADRVLGVAPDQVLALEGVGLCDGARIESGGIVVDLALGAPDCSLTVPLGDAGAASRLVLELGTIAPAERSGLVPFGFGWRGTRMTSAEVFGDARAELYVSRLKAPPASPAVLELRLPNAGNAGRRWEIRAVRLAR